MPLVTTLAGNGFSQAVDGEGNLAQFSSPIGISLNSRGDVIVVDSGNKLIRYVAILGKRFISCFCHCEKNEPSFAF